MIQPRLVLTAMGIAALISACGYNPADIPVETPELAVREQGTVPRDSTKYLREARGVSLVVNFNRQFAKGELSLVQLVPEPLSTGRIHNPGQNQHQVVIENVVFQEWHSTYQLVIDGPAMPQPAVLTYYTEGYPIVQGAMQGSVDYDGPGGEGRGVLVYALPAQEPVGDEAVQSGGATLFGRHIRGATKAVILQSEDGAWYRIAGLDLGARYFVVAIVDSNDDGQYDSDTDWWGYRRSFNEYPLEVIAGMPNFDEDEVPGPPMDVEVDFSLRPPGRLPGL